MMRILQRDGGFGSFVLKMDFVGFLCLSALVDIVFIVLLDFERACTIEN